MNTTTQASRFIPITNPDLRFMGRIDRTPADHQTWAFPYTQVSFRCTGTSIGVRLVNHWGYGDAYLGAIIDGMQVKARVPIDGAHDGISMENGYPSRVEPTGQQDDGPRHPVDVAIAADLPNIEHEVTIFKRQDEGNNRFDVYGILLDEGAKLMPTATPLPERRIEVYGDSVTCGERCEAACYVGQADPEVDLSPYSNAWYSYAAITARNLGAQAHLVSQGGTTLLDASAGSTRGLHRHGKHLGQIRLQHAAGRHVPLGFRAIHAACRRGRAGSERCASPRFHGGRL